MAIGIGTALIASAGISGISSIFSSAAQSDSLEDALESLIAIQSEFNDKVLAFSERIYGDTQFARTYAESLAGSLMEEFSKPVLETESARQTIGDLATSLARFGLEGSPALGEAVGQYAADLEAERLSLGTNLLGTFGDISTGAASTSAGLLSSAQQGISNLTSGITGLTTSQGTVEAGTINSIGQTLAQLPLLYYGLQETNKKTPTTDSSLSALTQSFGLGG